MCIQGVYFDEEEEKQVFKKAKINANTNKDWLKIGFIGISNWVLDPAKMNRGIFVNRSSPSVDELKDTFKGICKNDNKILKLLEKENLIDSLCKAYLELCEQAKKTREFFGLRDFYSLIKMIYWNIKKELDENGNYIKFHVYVSYLFRFSFLSF